MTAVHAGDAIAHRLEQRDHPKRPTADADRAYLEELGLTEAMPRWIASCTERDDDDA